VIGEARRSVLTACRAHVVIGANCKLIAHVHVTAQTTIGDGCTIYPFVLVGHAAQSLSYRGELTRLQIGQDCTSGSR